MNYEIQNQYGVLTVTEPDSAREIRFITPEYREQFRIRDGESVLLSANGTRREVVCRYLDDYHLVFAGRGYHICELAEALQRMGATVEPLPEKRMVWSDHDLNLRDWIKDLAAEEPGLTREEYETRMVETNANYLDDERANLDIPVDGDILVICDLGLWDGRHSGYTLIPDGSLSDCLSTATIPPSGMSQKTGSSAPPSGTMTDATATPSASFGTMPPRTSGAICLRNCMTEPQSRRILTA